MFREYPYLNLQDLNLDYIIRMIREMQTELNNFVSANAIKYADPIQWNITKQYEKNTVVIDPLTGTAYLSVQPVPNGISISNPDYWTVIFDLSSFVVKTAKNFTSHFEEETTLTATFPSAVNDWIVWGDTLYYAISSITAGDQYVIGSNIVPVTIEDVVGHIQDLLTTDKTNIVAAINEIVTNIGDLNSLNTTDKSNLVAAVNEVLQTLFDTTGNLNDLVTVEHSNLVAAINENHLIYDYIVTPEMFGAEGDGVTDDTNAINAAIAASNYILFKDGAIYAVDADVSIKPKDGQILNLNGATLKAIPNSLEHYQIIDIDAVNGVVVMNGTILGERDDHIGSTGEWGYGIRVYNAASNIVLDNLVINKCWGDGICLYGKSSQITIQNSKFDYNSRNGITVGECSDVFIINNIIEHTDRTLPKAGIDVEPDANQYAKNILISGNIFRYNGETGTHAYGYQNQRDKVVNLHITDNTYIIGTGERALYIASTTNTVVDNNDIILDTAGNGIIFVDDRNSKVSNNTISGATAGNVVYLYDCQDTIVDGNSMHDVTSTSGCIFRMVSSSYCMITNNVIKRCTCSGSEVFFLNTEAGLGNCSYNVIAGNTLFRVVPSKYVFYFDGTATYNRIDNNNIDGTYEYVFYRNGTSPSVNNAFLNEFTDGSIGTASGSGGSYGGYIRANVVSNTWTP